jgi:hypothetical protein
VLFVLLALAILAAVLAFHAGKYILQRFDAAESVPPLPPPKAELTPIYQSPPYS